MTSGGGFGVTAKAISTTSSNETKSAAETAAAVKKFTALGVCEQLAEAAAALGWTAPTEIQAAAVPHLLAGTACEEKEEREGERERERERKREPSIRRLATACFPPPQVPFFSHFSCSPSPLLTLYPSILPFHPLARTGKDVIGLAQTGSGKTGAFALPILQVRE